MNNKCLEIKRLNWVKGSYIFLTDAPDEVIEKSIPLALNKGEDEVRELEDILIKNGYMFVEFDEVVTDFDF